MDQEGEEWEDEPLDDGADQSHRKRARRRECPDRPGDRCFQEVPGQDIPGDSCRLELERLSDQDVHRISFCVFPLSDADPDPFPSPCPISLSFLDFPARPVHLALLSLLRTPGSGQDHVRVLRAGSDGGDPSSVSLEGSLVDERLGHVGWKVVSFSF